MSYELHIEREDDYLEYDVWRELVSASTELRADPDSEDDAQLEIDGEWITVFWWSNGEISFKLGDFSERVLELALKIANALHGEVRGDDGEAYTNAKDLWPV